MAKALKSQTVYHGPDLLQYPKIGSIEKGEVVSALWREGIYVHIEYKIAATGKKKRGYVPSEGLLITEALQPLLISAQARYLSTRTKVYTGPSASDFAEIGEFDTDCTLIYLGVKVNDFAFVEYTISPKEKGRCYCSAALLATKPVEAKPPLKTEPRFKPECYADGQVINGKGERWKVTNTWAGNNGHLAVDIIRKNASGANVSQEAVYAIADGKRIENGVNRYNGGYTILQHTTKKGAAYYSFYCHLSASESKSTFLAGEKVGLMGNTGASSRGEHLHLAITKQRPIGDMPGYYRVGGLKTLLQAEWYFDYNAQNDAGVIYHKNRFYNPTAYFLHGDAMIDRYYI